MAQFRIHFLCQASGPDHPGAGGFPGGGVYRHDPVHPRLHPVHGESRHRAGLVFRPVQLCPGAGRPGLFFTQRRIQHVHPYLVPGHRGAVLPVPSLALFSVGPWEKEALHPLVRPCRRSHPGPGLENRRARSVPGLLHAVDAFLGTGRRRAPFSGHVPAWPFVCRTKPAQPAVALARRPVPAGLRSGRGHRQPGKSPPIRPACSP